MSAESACQFSFANQCVLRDNPAMLVLLGGFPGSGKRRLARGFAAATGYFWHDASRTQSIPSPGTFDGKMSLMMADHERVLRAVQIASDFPRLAQQWRGVVIENMLHRRIPREHLMSAGALYFPSVVPIWIESDEASVLRRITETAENNAERVRLALERRTHDINQFEPFKEPIPRFTYLNEDADAIESLIQLVETASGCTIIRNR